MQLGVVGTSNEAPIVFGEVLFDVFPDGTRVLGGAPFNVAWHLAALGLDPLMITRVGADADGDAVLERMGDWGMRTDGVQRDPERPTGQVQVQLVEGEPHYRILDGVAWDAIATDALPPHSEAALLYHGTLAARGPTSRATLQHLANTLDGARFLDVNLRDPWWEETEVLEAVATATHVKLNEDELARLTGGSDPQALLASPCVQTVVLTRGARGAVWMDDATGRHRVRPEETDQVGDPVGAGDAFAAVCIAGLVRDWPVQTTLQRATTLASRVVALRGATASDRSLYDGLGG